SRRSQPRQRLPSAVRPRPLRGRRGCGPLCRAATTQSGRWGMDWYLKVIRNYVGFSGRARRKEYWMFVLINIVISIVLAMVDGMLGLKVGGEQGAGLLGLIYSLAILLPSIAVGVRRLHDTGRSGWWMLIAF